jgi:AcrR family transcriptional regulator
MFEDSPDHESRFLLAAADNGRERSTMNGQVATRRRGAALEDAILDAAWSELVSTGYSNLTFEAVSKRAGTSRPVLYRRWPTRASLASAAIARQVNQNPLVVPDLGNLRDELCLLLRKFADRSPPRLIRLVFEMSEDMAAENSSFTDERFQANPMRDLIERGLQRGEIDPQRLTGRVLRVPLSLAVHEVIVTGKQLSEEAISEIVDQVFLPLVVPLTRAEAVTGASSETEFK